MISVFIRERLLKIIQTLVRAKWLLCLWVLQAATTFDWLNRYSLPVSGLWLRKWSGCWEKCGNHRYAPNLLPFCSCFSFLYFKNWTFSLYSSIVFWISVGEVRNAKNRKRKITWFQLNCQNQSGRKILNPDG